MNHTKTKKSKRDDFIKVYDEADGTGKEKIILLAKRLLGAKTLMKKKHTEPPKSKTQKTSGNQTRSLILSLVPTKGEFNLFKMRFNMRHKVLYTFVLFVFFVCQNIYAQVLPYKDAIKKAADDILAGTNSNDKVAVVEFKSATEQFTNRVINDLINELVNNRVRVIDRQNLDKLHAEQDYQASGYVDDTSAVSIGKELGATVIVLGSGENMADFYQFNFRVLDVETAAILMQSSERARYNSLMERLLDEKRYSSSGVGTTHFAIGARLGIGFGINETDDRGKDGGMVETGPSPKEKSNIVFPLGLYGAIRLNDAFGLQTELNFIFYNGMKISGGEKYNTAKFDYTTIDIPLLFRWNFIRMDWGSVGMVVGPYISFPVSKLNLDIDGYERAYDIKGWTWGGIAGFILKSKWGLFLDARFMMDILPLYDSKSIYVSEDFGDGIEEYNIMYRKSINVTIGYEFSL